MISLLLLKTAAFSFEMPSKSRIRQNLLAEIKEKDTFIREKNDRKEEKLFIEQAFYNK
ncbi:hypothetical protein [Enterococcus lactis]|uniref:hypothetical protein n=1 Tax=Enterococcus lactis TaxID=357441 RepID=UPI000A8E2E3F